MDMKAMVSLLALMVFATTTAVAFPPEKPHWGPSRKAPAPSPHKPPPYHHGPEKAPPPHPHYQHHHHAPEKAPCRSPEEHHHHHHAPPPMHYSFKVRPPLSATKFGCTSKCEEYCKKDQHKKEECLDACNVCCEESKCVPEPQTKCRDWSHFKVQGKVVNCP